MAFLRELQKSADQCSLIDIATIWSRMRQTAAQVQS